MFMVLKKECLLTLSAVDNRLANHHANTDHRWIHEKGIRSGSLLLYARPSACPGEIKNMALRIEGKFKISLTKGANA